MGYIENPKTKGSGVICAIPQKGECPVGCADCFFQSGRSYLEPLDEHLPNMPSIEEARGRVVRMNDGNDSNNERELVLAAAKPYEHVFFNTSIPKDLGGFGKPVVLTVNPGKMTDTGARLLNSIPPNLMFVRVRVNTWNLDLVREVVRHYSARKVPVVLTFMAYYTESLPEGHEGCYTYRKRTMNSYWVITPNAWNGIMAGYADNQWVYACGKDADTFACHRCGNCLREYFATMERLLSRRIKNVNDMHKGMRVRVAELSAETDSFFVSDKHTEVRKAGAKGTVIKYVPGCGGDVWLVRHDHDDTYGTYGWYELEALESE